MVILSMILTFKHGVKSYEIIQRLLAHIYAKTGRKLKVVDLTFGIGRFYRLSRNMIDRIITVDIRRYEWEVRPTKFYQMDCRIFVQRVMSGEIELGDIDVIIIDPPWSSEKRGKALKQIGISKLPYHLTGINSESMIQAALELSRYINKPLLYRYKEPLECEHMLRAMAEVKIIRNKGWVYYGVCHPP
jgi:hypothetical protein